MMEDIFCVDNMWPILNHLVSLPVKNSDNKGVYGNFELQKKCKCDMQ